MNSTAEIAATVVLPCRNAEKTVSAALKSALSSDLREIEVVAVDDGSTDGTKRILQDYAARDPRVRVLDSGGRGVSAARNAALDVARGEFVFFLDADDEVDPAMYLKCVEAMRRCDADYCRVAHDETDPATGRRTAFPLKRDYGFGTHAEIVESYLPCFFGYSFGQIKAWYAGEPLWSRREKGVVWAAGFRLSAIRSSGVRFDERISVFEDAMFTSEYLAVACQRTVSAGEILYHYKPRRGGALDTRLYGPEMPRNKLRILERRKAIDARCGGELAGLYGASCVLSLLELLHAAAMRNGIRKAALSAFLEYGRDAAVRAALADFPLSWRKPVLAAAVLFCRLFFRAGRR